MYTPEADRRNALSIGTHEVFLQVHRTAPFPEGILYYEEWPAVVVHPVEKALHDKLSAARWRGWNFIQNYGK